MMVKIIIISLSLLLSVFLNTTSLGAQNSDRRHWKYITDLSSLGSDHELYKLSAKSWTGACYIGDDKAVTFVSGDLFIFNCVDKDNPTWSRIDNISYYKINSEGVRTPLDGRFPPTNIVGNSLAYVGDSKILLGPGRLGSVSPVNYKETWVFDLSDSSWTLMLDDDDSIPQIYDYGMCHLIDDKVLIFGGLPRKGYANVLDKTYIYDLSNNEWTEITSDTTPDARLAHSITALGNGSAIMFGGIYSNGGSGGETWVFDYSGGDPTWTQIVPAVGEEAPGVRYYTLLQKLSTDIAILYGGTSNYSNGEGHYNDLWRFNYDRETKTGIWTDISLSDKPAVHPSSDKNDYLYYPADSTDPLANDNYRNVDGESENNEGGGYFVDASDSTNDDHWGKYHGNRRATINAFLGNDRILLHGGATYNYDGSSAYTSSHTVFGKTYMFDLGIPDVHIDSVTLDPLTNNVDVAFTVEKLVDDRGEPVDSGTTIDVSVMYKRAEGDDSYVVVPVTLVLDENNDVSEVVTLYDLPPNTEIEIVVSIDIEGFGANHSDPVTIITAGGDKSVHLVNSDSDSDGVSGVNDYRINSSDTLNLSSGFTISQWIKLEDVDSEFKIERDMVDSPISLTVTDNLISMSILGSSSQEYSCEATVSDLSSCWYHIAFVFDPINSKQVIYIDGEKVAEGSNSGSIYDLNLADLVFDLKRGVNIDEFQVWGKAISEIALYEMLYQPIHWTFPNEVHGTVDDDLIDGVIWDDLYIYYKADHLDQGSPFSSTIRGCICQVTGASGMSLVNTVPNAGYVAETKVPYINWRKDAMLGDFDNPDNWFSGMFPESSSIESFQSIVVNSNTNGVYPHFDVANFDPLHTLVMRPETKLYVGSGTPLSISRKLVYDDGGAVIVENQATLVIGGSSDVTVGL